MEKRTRNSEDWEKRNCKSAKLALAASGWSANPAFDMLSVSEDIDTMFAEEFDAGLKGTAPNRTKLYRTCEENDVGITVMKGFAGGRLFDEERCPFGVPIAERMQKTAELFGR